jgi:hypothetical protein
VAHGVHRSWIYRLIARYRDGGHEALQPRSRRPRSCKHGTPIEVVERVVKLRESLQKEGHDCGAATIAYHLSGEPQDGRQRRLSRRSGGSCDGKAWLPRNPRSGRTAA